jgi:hypothetical protein
MNSYSKPRVRVFGVTSILLKGSSGVYPDLFVGQFSV